MGKLQKRLNLKYTRNTGDEEVIDLWVGIQQCNEILQAGSFLFQNGFDSEGFYGCN